MTDAERDAAARERDAALAVIAKAREEPRRRIRGRAEPVDAHLARILDILAAGDTSALDERDAAWTDPEPWVFGWDRRVRSERQVSPDWYHKPRTREQYDAERDAAARERHAPTEEQIAQVLSQHWSDMHTNESLGRQRMLARAVLALFRAEGENRG